MKIAEDVIMLYQRHGVGRTVQHKFTRKPRHYNRPDVGDGCAGIVTILFLILMGTAAKCHSQTNFPASLSTLTDRETGIVEKANVGMFVEFSRDTVTVRGRGVIFRQTGVSWLQDGDVCRGSGPGYSFRFWPGRVEIENEKIIWTLEK